MGKLNRTNLKEETRVICSFIIGILGKDQEGEYKLEFIRKVLKAAREKLPSLLEIKKLPKKIKGKS